jgi:hypothetical protein
MARIKDDTEYLRFVVRAVRAAGERIAEADLEQLKLLVEMRDTLERAIDISIRGLRAQGGATWADIGQVMGTTGQAATIRYKPRIEALDGVV